MEKQIVATDKAPGAVGPYSQGVQVGDFVYTAGQLGLIPGTTDFSGPDVESQTKQALQNLKAVLEAGGSCLEHVVKTTVFLQDMGEFAQMNGVYAQFFTSNLQGHLVIPLSELFEQEQLAKLPTELPIVVMCKSGARATAAVTALRHIGFTDSFVLKGGFKGLVTYLGAKEAYQPLGPETAAR